MKQKIWLAAALAGALAGLSVSTSYAQDAYPSRLVRFIQPLGPGSPGDIVTRTIAEAFTKSTGQPAVVENRVGANGIIGMDACAKAAPDGYSICVPSFSQMSVNPVLYKKLPYDPLKDLSPVILFAAIASVISVNPAVPVHSIKELIALAKAKPGALNWGSWGVGSFSHLYMAWLQNQTGTSFVHVPYKTLGQAITGVIAGEVQVMVNTPAVAGPLVQAGKMRTLAIIGGGRSPLIADTPTLQEEGFTPPLSSWVGIMVPAGTPKPIVQKLNGEFGKLLRDPDFVARYLTPGSLTPLGNTPEEFEAFLKSDRATMEKLAADAHIPKE